MGVSLSSGLDGHFPLQGDTFSRCSSVLTKHVAHKTVHEEVWSDRIMIFGTRQLMFTRRQTSLQLRSPKDDGVNSVKSQKTFIQLLYLFA